MSSVAKSTSSSASCTSVARSRCSTFYRWRGVLHTSGASMQSRGTCTCALAGRELALNRSRIAKLSHWFTDRPSSSGCAFTTLAALRSSVCQPCPEHSTEQIPSSSSAKPPATPPHRHRAESRGRRRERAGADAGRSVGGGSPACRLQQVAARRAGIRGTPPRTPAETDLTFHQRLIIIRRGGFGVASALHCLFYCLPRSACVRKSVICAKLQISNSGLPCRWRVAR